MKKIKLNKTNIGDIKYLLDESESEFVKSRNDNGDLDDLLKRFVKNNKLKLFKLQIDLETVGFVSLFHSNIKDTVAIGPMYISKKFRCKGYGRLQIVELIKYCRDKNYKEIKTKTWGKNIASKKIFDSLGFELYEEVKNNRVDGDSTVKYKICL